MTETSPQQIFPNPAGFADIAKYLNHLHPNRMRPYSRQLVHKWFSNRGTNGFPAPVSSRKWGQNRVIHLFDMDAVLTWYHRYRSTRLTETTPLDALTTHTTAPIEGNTPCTEQPRSHPNEAPATSPRSSPELASTAVRARAVSEESISA